MKRKLLFGLLVSGVFVLGILTAEKARKIKLNKELDRLLEELNEDDKPF